MPRGRTGKRAKPQIFAFYSPAPVILPRRSAFVNPVGDSCSSGLPTNCWLGGEAFWLTVISRKKPQVMHRPELQMFTFIQLFSFGHFRRPNCETRIGTKFLSDRDAPVFIIRPPANVKMPRVRCGIGLNHQFNIRNNLGFQICPGPSRFLPTACSNNITDLPYLRFRYSVGPET